MTIRTRTLLPAAALLAIAALAAGCGGSDQTSVSTTDAGGTTTGEVPIGPDQNGATGSTGATGATGSTSATGATASAGGTEPAGKPKVAGIGAVSEHVSNFQSPTGNIACVIGSGTTRCDIADRSFKLPPKPANCDLDWGQGLSFTGNSGAEIVCAGDTTLNPEAPALGYGEVTRVGPVLCQSAPQGMSCANSKSGHGFFLSRERYQTY